MKISQLLQEHTYPCAALLALSLAGSAQQQVHALSSSDGIANEYFGHAIDLAGNTAIIGSYPHAHPFSNQGAAYVFDLATGMELRELLALDGGSNDSFGFTVATDGVRAVVGANSSDFLLGGGAAYVFDLASGKELHKLHASDGVIGDSFAGALAVEGPRLVVGAPQANLLGGPPGAIYIFDTESGAELHKLQPLDSEVGDRFGWAVAISGKHAVVGAYLHSGGGTLSGSAYIFDVSSGQQLFKLIPSDGFQATSFGYSVDIDGDRAIVGARKANAAYVFDVNTGQQLMKLVGNDSVPGDFFGNSVGVSGERAVVGAHRDDDNGFDSGAAYVFEITTGAQLFKLVASNGAFNDLFAKDTRIDRDTVLVGALGHDQPVQDAGKAFVFALPPDCNENGIPDTLDISSGSSSDNDLDGVPDECGDLAIYCVGDGSGQPCPCGNNGAANEGCANSGGSGVLCFGVGTTRASADDLLIASLGLLPGNTAMLIGGGQQIGGGTGIPFGNGRLCVGAGLLRMGVRQPDAAGTAQWGPGLVAQAGWSAGDTRYLQVWYRDPQGLCGSAFNMSNGLSVRFQP